MAKIKRAGICLFVATTLIGLVQPAHAQREGSRQGGEVRGVVKSVDAASITLTIGGGRDTPPAEKAYSLAKDVEICTGVGGGFRLGGAFKEAKRADLTAGVLVSLNLSADQKTVESIMADEPIVRGVLKLVDAKKQTLTVVLQQGREESGQEQSYQLAADAEIAIDDGRGRRFSIREGKIDELADGALVTLRLSLDKRQVHSVLAEGSMISGVIKALDPAKRSMTITTRPPRGDEAGEDRIVAIAKEALIVIDDGKGRRLSLKEAKLADVPVGSAVTVKLAVDQSFVMTMRVEGPRLFGLLKGVDTDKRTITITISKGRDDSEEKTLTLAKDAHITHGGNNTKLADLKVADNPLVELRLSPDQKLVQGVSAHQPRPR